MFIQNYSYNIKQGDVLDDICKINQESDGSFTEFLKQFKAAATQVNNMREKYFHKLFRNALLQGEIRDPFTGHILESLDKVYTRARKQDKLKFLSSIHKVYSAGKTSEE